jgi:four helix bundle protein
MATFKKIEDIRVWHLAQDFTHQVYAASGQKRFRDSDLRSQLRASVSIVSNIGEGFGRGGNREFIQFLSHANGSAVEAISQLHIACREDFITIEDLRTLVAMAQQIMRMITGLMGYLRTSDYRGHKFLRS